MTYAEAKAHVALELLHYRKMARLVNTPNFLEACDVADEYELGKLGPLIKEMNAGRVRAWMKHILRRNWEDYPAPQLRQIARRYNIPKWNLLDKTNLIEAITIAKRRTNITG